MKTINQITFIIIAILCSFNSNFAQNSSTVYLGIGADMVSRYVWRGTQFGGTSPSVQPFVKLGIGKFVVGAWASYSIGGKNSSQELDFYATYSLLGDKLSITLTDYFFPNESSDYNYFNYDKNTTGHVIEASASFNGTDKIPLSVLIAVNLFGDDPKRISDDITTLNEGDGIQYSTYLEIGFSTTFKNVDLKTFLGLNLTEPRVANSNAGYLGDKDGYYGNYAGVVNLGITLSKEIKFSDKFSLPVMTSIITNPQTGKTFMVFGFSL